MRRKTSKHTPSQSASESAATDAAGDGGGTLVSTVEPIAESEIGPLFASLTPFSVLILAVSGGADSMAMMHLAARWSELHPDPFRTIVVATVDHDLRPESRREAEWVAGEAHAIGIAHELLSWTGVKPTSGIQDAARAARYRLLAELAWRLAGAEPAAIVTAHTVNDQAETFLMRLARGSGIDGLTGMSASRLLGREAHCRLVRPLLGVDAARLRATLQAHGRAWIEDPSNDCDRFERVRLRKAFAPLQAAGLTAGKIALSARRLERARAALEAGADALGTAAELDVHEGMFASLQTQVLRSAPEELRVRLMARLIAAFGGQDEPVRLARLEALIARMQEESFEAATLGGCIVLRQADEIRVFREPGRTGLPEIALTPGRFAVWDRRFRVGVAPELGTPVCVRALGGPGFAALRRHLRNGGPLPPARAAATLPAFWRDDELLAVPSLAPLASAPAARGRKDGLCSAEFLW